MWNIGAEKLPFNLNDEQRLDVLFAPLRNKSVNPKDWGDKISTWKSIIKAYCETNNIFSFSLSTLNEVFVRHGRPPQCLSEVIADMVMNHDVEVMEIFLMKTSHTWSGWLTDVVVKKPLSWSYNTIKKKMFGTNNLQCVHLEAVKTKSSQFLTSVPDHFKNKVISLQELTSILGGDIPDLANLKILLHYLENQQKIAIQLSSDPNELSRILIKIGDGDSTHSISDIDIGIHTLEQNEKLISKHVESLEDQIEVCVEEAKNHLKMKHRQLAKSSLIKKHQLEKQLEKKANALHNVQNCLEQLKGTHTNSQVFEAYKNALHAFNTTYKDTGISEESVDDTMLKLAEALDVNEEIQSALGRAPNEIDDTSALEAELEELMASDQPPPPNDDSGMSDDLDKRFQNLRLPDVPDRSPDISAQEAI